MLDPRASSKYPENSVSTLNTCLVLEIILFLYVYIKIFTVIEDHVIATLRKQNNLNMIKEILYFTIIIFIASSGRNVNKQYTYLQR